MRGFAKRISLSGLALLACLLIRSPRPACSQEAGTPGAGPPETGAAETATPAPVPAVDPNNLVPTPEQKARIDAFAKEIHSVKQYFKAELAFRKIHDLGNLALPTVIELSHDKSLSPEILNVVIRQLLQFDHPMVFPEALSYLDSENSQTRFFALNAVRKTGGKASVQVGLKALDDPDAMVRRVAANILLDQASPDLLPVYDRLKVAADPEMRSGGLILLNRIDPKGFEAKYMEAILDPDASVRHLAAKYLDDLRGTPDLEKLIPYFSAPEPANRMFALLRLQVRVSSKLKAPLDRGVMSQFGKLPENFDERSSPLDSRLAPALKKLLEDPNESIRFAALQAVQSALQNEFAFFYDRDLLERVVKASRDESATVRTQALELVYNESIKVGIALPMSGAPQRYSLEVMRALHWDTDDLTIPAYIERLKDPDAGVRDKAFVFLKFSTGEGFGLSDFWDRKTPEITPEIVNAWQAWWDAEKAKTVQQRTVEAVDDLIRALPLLGKEEARLKSSVEALTIVTGTNFGWKPTLTNAEKMAIYKKYEEWWSHNKTKHRAAWIVDSLHVLGLDKVRPESLHILSRIANRSFGMEMFMSVVQKKANPQLMERVDTWWNGYRKQHGIQG